MLRGVVFGEGTDLKKSLKKPFKKAEKPRLTDCGDKRNIPPLDSEGEETERETRRNGGRRMNFAVGLMGLALLGADGTTTSKAARPIQYHVRVLEMNGLEWREGIYTKLAPVSRQGTATIWTADKETSRTLIERAGRVVMSPQVMAQSDAVAHFSQRTSRRVVSKLTRLADGPVDHAIAVAYSPDYEEVRDGCQFSVTGRRLDQGILAKVVIDETQVAAVHQVKLTEIVPARDNRGEAGKLTPQLEVPEVVSATVAGEWLIPTDGILLVSFGARTLDDGQGKAVVRERLMLVEAVESQVITKLALEKIQTPKVFSAVIEPPVISPPVPQAPMPAPAVPSRSLPQARNFEGVALPLPPLPEEPAPPSSMPESSEPCATPQTRSKPVEKSVEKTVDPASTKASFLPDPTSFLIPDSTTRFLVSTLKPLLFRVPLSAGITIEIKASMKPGS